MGPSITSFLQSIKDGGPLGIMPSMASTNLKSDHQLWGFGFRVWGHAIHAGERGIYKVCLASVGKLLVGAILNPKTRHASPTATAHATGRVSRSAQLMAATARMAGRLIWQVYL